MRDEADYNGVCEGKFCDSLRIKQFRKLAKPAMANMRTQNPRVSSPVLRFLDCHTRFLFDVICRPVAADSPFERPTSAFVDGPETQRRSPVTQLA